RLGSLDQRRRLAWVRRTHVGCRPRVSIRRQGELHWVRQIMGSRWFYGADRPDGRRFLLSLIDHDLAKRHLPVRLELLWLDETLSRSAPAVARRERMAYGGWNPHLSWINDRSNLLAALHPLIANVSALAPTLSRAPEVASETTR